MSPAQAPLNPDTIERDVVVVGAGPAGLRAAREIQAHGRSVAVLEARDRVGGRTWSKDVDGAFLEIGGQWVSPDQTELLDLLQELGKETYPRFRDGANVYIDAHGKAHRFTTEMFPAGEATEAEMERLIGILDQLVAEIGVSAPWAHPHARELDTISFSQWLKEHSDDAAARENIGIFMAGGMLTKPAHSFSTLQAILMAASAGSFSNLVDENFILDRRVVGGMQSVSEAMAAELSPQTLFLNSPVRAVRWESPDNTSTARAAAVVSDAVIVRADQVIIAVPPNLYSRIGFEPALPWLQQQMHQHQSMGVVIKVHAVYDTPFWRDKELSGTGFGATELCQEVYDNTNYGDSCGTLVAFVSDESADQMLHLDPAQRQAKILASLCRYLGEEALNPRVYYESDFASEEWTRGAYASSYDLGGLHRYGPYQQDPVGPIHWACSDLAAEGYQHVDGALRQGRTVAQDVLQRLGVRAEARQ